MTGVEKLEDWWRDDFAYRRYEILRRRNHYSVRLVTTRGGVKATYFHSGATLECAVESAIVSWKTKGCVHRKGFGK